MIAHLGLPGHDQLQRFIASPAWDEVPVPVGLHLFLPADRTADPAQCARAGMPEAMATPQSKSEITLTGLDRLRTEGLCFGLVLAVLP